jgi:hypothetical protein
MRTNVYIDGFNLYYGCLKGTTHKWLDLAAFCQASFPPPRNQINRIRYFTAHVNARPNDPQQPLRQQTFLRALRTIPHLSVHLGSYLEKPTRMPLHPPPATGPKTVGKTGSGLEFSLWNGESTPDPGSAPSPAAKYKIKT